MLHREAGLPRGLPAPGGVRSPCEDRPDRRNPRFSLRQKPVGTGERSEDRPQVGGPRAEVVEDDDRRAGLPAEAPEESGEDLRGRKPLAPEPFVQVLEHLRGDPMGAARPAGPDGDHDRRARPPLPPGALEETPGREPREGRGPRAGGSHHERPPRGGSGGNRVGEPADQSLQLDAPAEREWGDPILGEHLGVFRA
jgi:hypothetical protein